ncbi:hypothetical protein B0H16DRAFT_1894496 [Mycena metata]|uniref:F-box domain-containing protein n=1 Tax=Mycena metata TaxID=1033252 RepID=A0AAD7HS81_9AGAR|nr:hypothetical protein B0H16DRAFT_1894496 [Mycena metata]
MNGGQDERKLSIKLFNVNLSCTNAANLPDAVWLEIILKSNPLELLTFQKLSKRFRIILRDNPHCWVTARHNMHPPVPPPPQVNAAGVWTEAAYAQFIFGGGECAAKSCKRWTQRFPRSFALRIRVCSTKCEAIIHRHYDKSDRKINNSYLTSCAIPGKRGLRQMGQTQRLHFRNWLVYDERDMTSKHTYILLSVSSLIGGSEYPMYRVCAVSTADQEWFSARAITENRKARPPVAVIRTVPQLQNQYKLRAEALPHIMENAKALQQWAADHEEARTAMTLTNVAFMKEVVSPREQIPYRKLLKTPIVIKTLESFGRTLSKFDIRTWCAMRATAIREYRDPR